MLELILKMLARQDAELTLWTWYFLLVYIFPDHKFVNLTQSAHSIVEEQCPVAFSNQTVWNPHYMHTVLHITLIWCNALAVKDPAYMTFIVH